MMRVHTGHSKSQDSRTAADEATFGITGDPALLIAFAASTYDLRAVAETLSQRFPKTVIAGCSTAGEGVDGEHFQGSLGVLALDSPQLAAASRIVHGLAAFDEARATAVAAELFADLNISPEDADPTKAFCLMFVDGLSLKDELVVARMAAALGGIPLLGGSAGDDLRFRETQVFTAGQASSDAAVFVLVRSEIPFEIIKHQHFVTRPATLAITRADPSLRRVYEIDGLPAVKAYARALGMRQEDVTTDVAFLNPVTFVSDGEIYVRSIQKIEDDGSLIFYCAIEEGMVLDLAGHRPMTEAMDADFEPVRRRLGKASAFLGFNCILRALEASGAKLHDDLGKRYRDLADRSLWFDTYGEQLNGLHINQTLVGIAFGGAKEAA